jgi:hypothetical protein
MRILDFDGKNSIHIAETSKYALKPIGSLLVSEERRRG